MKFDGSSGRRPSAEARRYVYVSIAATLEADPNWVLNHLQDEELDEFDIRRIEKEVRKVARELRAKAAR